MGRRRSGKRWTRSLAVLAAVLAVLAVVSVAAVSHEHHSPAPAHAGSRQAGAAERARRAVLRLHHGGQVRLAPLARRESWAISRVLRYTSFVVAGSRRRRDIALTFDDGPSPYTVPILHILAHKHVPATFFVVGQQLNYFSTELGDEIRQHAVVGDHTENHAWLLRLNATGQTLQIVDDALRIRHQERVLPRLFRPPYGQYNATTLRVLHSMRMLMVLWSIDPGDWRLPGVRDIVQDVFRNARPGAIVLLHDGGGSRSETVAALSPIIDGLRKRHYRLVSVPRLIMDDPPPRHQRPPAFTGA